MCECVVKSQLTYILHNSLAKYRAIAPQNIDRHATDCYPPVASPFRIGTNT